MPLAEAIAVLGVGMDSWSRGRLLDKLGERARNKGQGVGAPFRKPRTEKQGEKAGLPGRC